jgi:hypothetical protein
LPLAGWGQNCCTGVSEALAVAAGAFGLGEGFVADERPTALGFSDADRFSDGVNRGFRDGLWCGELGFTHAAQSLPSRS